MRKNRMSVIKRIISFECALSLGFAMFCQPDFADSMLELAVGAKEVNYNLQSEMLRVGESESSLETESNSITNEIVYGDANQDGSINLKDYVTICRDIGGGWKVTFEEKSADVDCDDSVTLKDATLICRYIAGGWGVTLGPKNMYDENNVGEIYFEPTSEEHIAVSADGVTMYADNELMVVAKSGVSKTEIMSLAADYAAEVVGCIEQTGDYQIKLNNVTSEDELNEAITAFENNQLIESASRNYITKYTIESLTSDIVDYDINQGSQWDVMDANIYGEEFAKLIIHPSLDSEKYKRLKNGWSASAINAHSAWTFMNNNRTAMNPINVGVIDTGFYDHEDLAFAENGIFYDEEKNKIENAISPVSPGHGTHVAGIMAANTDGDTGISGIYPYGKGRLYGVALMGGIDNHSENEVSSSIQEKIAFAELIFRNVKVINCSFNDESFLLYEYESDYPNPEEIKPHLIRRANILGDYLNRVYQKGYDFVIVCSSGNESNRDVTIETPEKDYHIGMTSDENCSYASDFCTLLTENTYPSISERIITVGAVNANFDKAYYSNIGCSIYAPGGDGSNDPGIFSTIDPTFDGGKEKAHYGFMSGTSMASPHVAGVAANIWTANNKLTGADVKRIICDEKNQNSLSNEGIPVVDANKCVRDAFNQRKDTSDTEDVPQLGSVLGWVRYDTNLGSDLPVLAFDIALANAKVTAFDENGNQVQDKNGNNFDTVTDTYGHFELMVPAGTYELRVNHDKLKEEKVTVIVKTGEVKYLDGPICMLPSELSETDLKNLVENNTLSTIEEWYYNDYDGDGTYEAFAVITGETMPEGKQMQSLYFVTGLGVCSEVASDFEGVYLEFENHMFESNGRRFLYFCTENGNYGTDHGYLWTVVDQSAKQMLATSMYNGFSCENDQLRAFNYVHSGGLTIEEYDLVYNSEINDLERLSFVMSEDDLKAAIVSSSQYSLSAWDYNDFDGNGKNEAFALFVDENKYFQEVRFIDSKGIISVMRNEPFGTYTDGIVEVEYSDSIFVTVTSALGQAWRDRTLIYSVRDNHPYELKLSGEINGLYIQEGKPYTNKYEYGDNAQVDFWTVPVELEYNSDENEFFKHGETGSSEPEKQELYHWVVDPQFDYDFAGPIKKDHTTNDTFTAEYLDDNTIWQGSLCVYGVDGKFGITDYTGAMLTPPEYNNIHVGIDENCILTDSKKLQSRKMLPDGTLTPFVSLDQNLEVTNGWDQVAWDEETNHIIGISSFGELNESPIDAMPIYPVRKAIVRKYDGYQTYGIDWDGTYALAANDKLFSDFVFEKAGRYHEGIIPVKRDGKWGYVNKNGETVIPFEYDDAWERNRSMTINDENGHYADWAAYDATEGTVVLCQNGEYALYSTTGEEIIPFGVLEEISPLYEGKAWAKSDGLWGVIEVDGARK